MKVFTKISRVAFFMILASVMMLGCQDKRIQTITRIEYEPVYMSEQDYMNSIKMESSRELKEPGKIYFYQGYLFINESNEGVHIIDNSNPANPQKVGFINIPANKDIAVKNGLLYADSETNLLVFDIQDIQNPELIATKENVFEKSGNEAPGYVHTQVDPSKGIVVDWKKVEVEETCTGNCYGVGAGGIATADMALSAAEGGSGVGGSMARFTINGDYLYAVDKQNLLTFDISSQEPTQANKEQVGWDIETIFPYENSLYIGSASAMYIYDITTPDSPGKLSVYEHMTACDPVVVEGDLAYVTLRNAERCPRGVNRLEIIDVADRTQPQKIATYSMASPHGLGIDDGTLFISEGDKGLKIFDAGNALELKLIRHIKDIQTFDVIPLNDVLMVTGDDGIRQYDYSNIDDVTHLSTIDVVQDEES